MLDGYVSEDTAEGRPVSSGRSEERTAGVQNGREGRNKFPGRSACKGVILNESP